MAEPRIDHQISAKQVRLIDSEGVNLGVKPTKEAIAVAAKTGMSLVEVSSNSNPPTCKIMDWSREKYLRSKKSKQSHKSSRMKEVKFSPNIGKNDYETKLKAVFKFLKQGSKVKVSVHLRGREKYMPGKDGILDRIVEDLESAGATGSVHSRQRNEMLLHP